MHAIDLIEVAASFVRHAEAQIALSAPPPKESIHSFWLTCRYRHDVWSGRLASHRAAVQRGGASARGQQWYEITPILQEILVTEPLTRCVAQQALVLEETRLDNDFAALAQSAMAAHIEARHRCLHLIVFGTGLPTDLAVKLNRLRRHCESFTDQLLAMLRPTFAADTISFDTVATSWARSKLQSDSFSDSCRRLHTSSVVNSFLERTALDIDYRKATPRQNARLAQTVLGLLPTAMFDSFGVPHSHQIAKIEMTGQDGPSTDSATHQLSSPLDLLGPTNRNVGAEATHRRWS